ncbi:MAG TPA: tRNA (adenosine(37)-N6)-threonylcarbamoyltransferase complex dimerization subunit type 1 TsaB, partial [Pantoea septica]|nr:tRNA (adenosine(37)-N6)-threonylcarbamoyltransferase complex dimerization subunit type 1 TsaB [Pantoea septica]
EWFIAGTGWQAWPQLQQGHALTLRESGVELPAAEDMLPLAEQAWQRGATVQPEHAEPTYLRNEVAWKKLPGR